MKKTPTTLPRPSRGMHPQTRLCLEFMSWVARFESSEEVARAGASYAEITASLTPGERAVLGRMVDEKGEKWLADNWARLRIEILYIRSL